MPPARRPSQITALMVTSVNFYPGHVRVEGVPVVRVLSREGSHPDALWVTHLLEQDVQIPVRYRAQRDNSHVRASHYSLSRSADAVGRLA